MKFRSSKSVIKKINSESDTFGHIDSYESGQLSGWIKRKSSNDPVRFSVVDGSKTVGEGIANQFREDLSLANIGNGYHGFDVKISSDVNTSGNSLLCIVDSETKKVVSINHNVFQTESNFINSTELEVSDSESSIVNGHIDNLSNGVLSGWLRNTQSDTPIQFRIMVNDEVIGESVANLYREDLKELGFGSGKHGFEIKLDTDTVQMVSREIVKSEEDSCLHIVDTNTSQSIKVSNSVTESQYANSVSLVDNDLASPGVIGHVDNCSNGVLRGWIKDSQSDTPVRLRIMANEDVIGEGVANVYREDLKDLGYGSGKHGFEIALNVKTASIAGQKLSLVDLSNGNPITGIDFKLDRVSEIQTVFVESDGSIYRVLLESDSFESLSQVSGNLLVDGKYSNEWISDNKPTSNQFMISAPVSSTSADFTRHLFALELDFCDQICGESLQVVKPISTPWEHLKSSASLSIYSALDSISAYRYESLKLHMRDPEGTNDTAWLSNVSQAHDLVVEGYKGRKRYTKLVLPSVSNPDVSILIPAYNQFELTYNCIASIILAFNKASYEVILVDDCSDDETVSAVEYVDNLKVVRNEQNLRFLLSCNNGSRSARGKYITFLNNDTEVTSGWLDSMISAFDRFENVGLTGSKLIYPDGKLQEAGGMVWGNGQPWNIGNCSNAFAPEFNYTRQADYVSGAAMMIERSLWEDLGGFSEEFAPAYFEDTDLAFKVREAGKKVIYCHDSIVVHFEGMSNGTDLTEGVKRFQSVNFPKFREKWIRAYKNNGRVGQNLHLEMDRGIEYRALVIDYTTPEPSRDAGSYAAIQEIKLLQSHGFKVTFLPDNIAHMGKTTDAMQRSGVECLYHPFVESIQSYIEQHGSDFDVIYITRYDIARKYIETIRAKTNAKIIFNNADLHFLREIRAVISANGKDFTSALETREKELAVMKSVDVTLSYNEAEHAVIASHNVETNNVFKCPWVLYPKTSETAFEERNGIAFLGGYNHAPNVESVKYLAKHVMPKMLEKDKSIKLYVYGSAVTPEIENLASENIEIVGFAESLDEVYGNCRVFVAPLLSGAGIKGKVLESMSYGVPSVLSPIAAEGTGLSNGVSCLIADTSEEWVDQIITLYNDKSLWNRMAENSSLLTQTNYSFEAGQKAFKKILAHLGIYTLPDTTALYESHKDQ